jgi:hypothetical protein
MVDTAGVIGWIDSTQNFDLESLLDVLCLLCAYIAGVV